MTTAFLFPGQGSQRVGMGRDLLARRPELLARRYAAADEALGLPLTQLCLDGPAEALRQTEVTQPAVFLTSLAVLDALLDAGARPDAVAGHSLGEYTALVAAGVLDWTDALRLVRRRGELMAAVGARTPGRMLAVVGLPAPAVTELCRTAAARTGEAVEVANDNDPDQVVVSGTVAATGQVAAAAKARSARTVWLEVSAPFHCSLMRAVEEEFAEALAGVTLRDPRLPVVANVTADVVETSADVASCLRRQLAGQVRWTESLRRLAALGVTTFVEVGPGRVLSGTCRATVPGAAVLATSDLRRLDQAVAALTSGPAEPTAA